MPRSIGGQPCRLPRTIGPAALPNESGKNISMIMPAPFSQRHNGYLRNYLTTGKARILDSIREVVALHKERFVFPIRLAVTRVSGSGADSIFMVRLLVGQIAAQAHSAGGWRRGSQAPCCPALAEGAVLRPGRCSRARALLRAPLTPFSPLHQLPCLPPISIRASSSQWRTTRA